MIKVLLLLALPTAIALATNLAVVFSENMTVENQMYLSGLNHGAVLWVMVGFFMMALDVQEDAHEQARRASEDCFVG